jgi:hypothetical protein
MADTVAAVAEYIPIGKAAESLGISKRRALEYAQAGALRSVRQRDPATSQVGVMVSVTDVERLREERENPRPQPSQALEKPSGAAKSQSAALPALLEALADGRQWANWPAPLYLTEEQAIRYTGLGAAELRRCAKGATRGPRGALVYRRADLDEL